MLYDHPDDRLLLLVEDDLLSARLTTYVLRRRRPHWHVCVAQTMAQTAQLVTLLAFDLAILDLNLPDTQELVSLKALLNLIPHVPIVILTGMDLLEEPSLALGAIGFASKSVLAANPDGFVALIEASYARHHRLHGGHNGGTF